MTPLLTPTVNHIGTSRRDLVNQRLAASIVLHEALMALQGMAPHGRDYPTGPDAFQTDRDIHRARVKALWALREAIVQEGLALMSDD